MTRTYTVTGMSCGGCEQAVEDALEAIDGVEGATADNETDTVNIEGDFDDTAARTAIQDAGYTVEA